MNVGHSVSNGHDWLMKTCGVLNLPNTQSHAQISKFSGITLVSQYLPASQHQKRVCVRTLLWCWLADKYWEPRFIPEILLVWAWDWCTKSARQGQNPTRFHESIMTIWHTVNSIPFCQREFHDRWWIQQFQFPIFTLGYLGNPPFTYTVCQMVMIDS